MKQRSRNEVVALSGCDGLHPWKAYVSSRFLRCQCAVPLALGHDSLCWLKTQSMRE